MKKIAIVTRKLCMGGIEKALISMLNNINYECYSIDLYILEPGGELETNIPEHINIIHLCENSTSRRLIDAIKRFKFMDTILLIKLISTFFKNTSKYDKSISLLNTLKPINKKYDLAIAYHNPISICSMFVIEKLVAKNKVMWVHSDIKEYIEIVDDFKSYYDKFNKIFFVSKGCMNSFLDVYPQFQNKSEVFYNFISKKELQNFTQNIQRLDNSIFECEKTINILTVSRLAKEKGVDLIPSIATFLKSENFSFKWVIVGKGDLYHTLLNEVQENGLENEVTLYGQLDNPYYAMQECDIYVQPSRFEAYGLTIAEAKCFEKPIVATDIIGINEQIQSFINGVLCDFDAKDFGQKIIDLANNDKLRERIIENLKMESIDTRSEIQKLYTLME